MRIHIFSPYYPPHTGGLESHSEEFNRYLALKGVHITVFTPQLPLEAPTLEHIGSVRIIRFPACEIVPNFPLPKFWRFRTPHFWGLFRLLWQDHPDVVISRTRFFLSSFLALLYARLRHVPLVHIEHGSGFVKLSSRTSTLIAKLYDVTLGKFIFCHSHMNIAISKAVFNFIQKFDTRHTPIIYRGIDFSTIDSFPKNTSLRQQYPNKIIITTAARLYKWKGIENTLEAIRTLPTHLRDSLLFVIIGDGEDFSRLKQQSLELPVIMLGRLSRAETIGVLKATDIYVHSSFPGGGLSTSLLEAMYCGCTIIATPHEGANEVVVHQNNGLLLTDASITETQQALSRLLENAPDRHRYAEAAQRFIKNEFAWESSIKKYLSILESLIHEQTNH